MYIIVNAEKIIVASSVNKPSEEACSKNSCLVYKMDQDEYSPALIGSVLEDYDLVERI